VADSDYVVAQALSQVLDAEGDLTVTGTYADDRALMRGLSVLDADVLLVDPTGLSPECDEPIRKVREAHPEVKVIVLTASRGEPQLISAVRAGVRGYLSKSARIEEVLNAVRVAVKGGATLTSSAAAQLMDDYARQSSEETGLTPRQRDLLTGIVQGKSNREIAFDVHLSEKTVKNYMRGLFSALGVRDRTGAAVSALQRGLIAHDE
jgi:DNA-binding NarL/FixJ family response regulator